MSQKGSKPDCLKSSCNFFAALLRKIGAGPPELNKCLTHMEYVHILWFLWICHTFQ